MANMILSRAAANALAAATIKGNVLKLAGELKPQLYQEVAAAIALMGGKWNTRREAHIFKSDPSALISSAINGEEIIDQKKLYQEFYTPETVAKKVVKMARVKGKSVLEPSAGRGALVDASMKAGAATIQCVEQRDDSVATLREKGHQPHHGDFLDFVPVGSGVQASLGFFDRVVMNPPFSKESVVAHVRHALKFLKSDGVLVAIVPVKTESHDTAKYLPVIPEGFSGVIEVLPRHSFRESGTSVNTGILLIAPTDDASKSMTLRYVDPLIEKKAEEIQRLYATPLRDPEEILESLERSLTGLILEVRAMMDSDRHVPELHRLSTAIHDDVVTANKHIRGLAREFRAGKMARGEQLELIAA